MSFYESIPDPYCYPGSNVLINHFEIRDTSLLAESESELSQLAEAEIQSTPISGNFDLPHLQEINRRLLGSIYPWAGELRTVRISKDGSVFAYPENIKPFTDQLFIELQRENYLKDIPCEAFIRRIAYYLGELNAAHPFREGNGRTSRIFIFQLAHQAGYEIHFDKADPKEMIAASIASFHGDNTRMENLLTKITVCTCAEH